MMINNSDPLLGVTHRISIIRVPRRGRLHERAAEAAIYAGACLLCLALVAGMTIAAIWATR